MRDAIFGFCLLAFASPAFAQATEPRPFAMFGQLEVLKSESRGTLVGLDATVGVPVSEHVHLFGHFGRSHALMPDNLYSRLSVALQEASEIAGQEVTGAFWMPAWYGTAGGRWAFSPAWRFHPYAEASAGVARATSAVEYRDRSGTVLDVSVPTGVFRSGARSVTVPTSILGVGTHVYFGRTFTLDVGYRHQRYFGDADATDRGPFVGFGVRF